MVVQHYKYINNVNILIELKKCTLLRKQFCGFLKVHFQAEASVFRLYNYVVRYLMFQVYTIETLLRFPGLLHIEYVAECYFRVHDTSFVTQKRPLGFFGPKC